MSIRIQGLTKRYRENVVVSKVSLDVQDGELFVLLGGSGSGKTTVLRMIAGLIIPDEGRVELSGRDVTHLSPQDRNTGFVFQNYSVFRHMTVAENVRFGLKIRGVPAREQARRSAALLEMVGLTGFGERYPNQLSGGQLQRVALARALAYDPAVLLLDEPFSALDVKIRAQLRENLRTIQRELKVTTIMVTHDQEEAFELADRIGVMDRGLLMEVGTPETLYHRPQTEFTAAFIGGGNVLVGRAEAGGIQLGQITLPFPAGAPAHDDGAPVRILFRPETVVLQDGEPEPGSGLHSLGQAEVLDKVFAGSLQRVSLAVGGLRGARALKPSPRFGASRTLIHSAALTTQSGAPVQPGQVLHIGIRGYHVLEPSGMKVLIDAGSSPVREAVLDFSRTFVQACGGRATLLRTVPPEAPVETELQELQVLQRKSFAELPQVDARVRAGDPEEETILEALQGDFEVVVLPHAGGEMGELSVHLCRDVGLPVLLVPESRSAIRRILICTAGGEPGKSDIRVGGRIARRARADATLFHVRPPGVGPEAKARTDNHLELGRQALFSLGVSGKIKIDEQSTVVPGVLAEIERGGYDLVVIGAPAARAPNRLYWTDLATPIALGSRCPLLIVPAPG